MRHSARLLPLLVVSAVLGGCAASHAIAPLEKGQSGITSSLGGPFVQYGSAPIPLPIVSLGYRYGIDGHTDVHGSLYVTQLALFKVGGFDVGVARELITADGPRPRIMMDLNTHWFFGDRAKTGPDGGFRFFPDLSLMATWDLGRAKHHLYVGVDNFFEVAPSFRYYPTPILGTELKASKGLGIQLELGWLAPWKDTLPVNPVWYGPGNLGAVSVKLGFNGYFPTKKTRAQHVRGPQPDPDPVVEPALAPVEAP